MVWVRVVHLRGACVWGGAGAAAGCNGRSGKCAPVCMCSSWGAVSRFRWARPNCPCSLIHWPPLPSSHCLLYRYKWWHRMRTTSCSQWFPPTDHHSLPTAPYCILFFTGGGGGPGLPCVHGGALPPRRRQLQGCGAQQGVPGACCRGAGGCWRGGAGGGGGTGDSGGGLGGYRCSVCVASQVLQALLSACPLCLPRPAPLCRLNHPPIPSHTPAIPPTLTYQVKGVKIDPEGQRRSEAELALCCLTHPPHLPNLPLSPGQGCQDRPRGAARQRG